MPRPKKTHKIRHRFTFKLDGSKRDRVIAEYINDQPNASETIKALIYREAMGMNQTVVYAQRQAPEEEMSLDDPRVRILVGAIDD